MDELKPCPFCGSNNLRKNADFVVIEKEKTYEHKLQIFCIYCINCGASGPSIRYGKDAIQDWNKRYAENMSDE